MSRVRLARLPTPIARLDRLSAELDAEIWVKRDDLTGFALSGNKVRKLEFLLGDAVAKGATTVVTTGGIGSNHCRATAVAARMLGLQPVLLLRGEPPEVADGNLLLDQLLGAAIHWCTPEEYAERRNERMEELASDLRSKGEIPYVIPEGGSNALGSRGYEAAAEELAEQAPRFDVAVCAVGSGGTLAGLALGNAAERVVGMAVCDDEATFRGRVESIALESGKSLAGRWEVDDRFRGEAYAVASSDIWRTIARVARLEGLFLDPVYTGKAMHGLIAGIGTGEIGGRVLFWHTGGAFGLFGRGSEAP